MIEPIYFLLCLPIFLFCIKIFRQRRITAAANNMTNMPGVCFTYPFFVANGVTEQCIICSVDGHDHSDEFGSEINRFVNNWQFPNGKISFYFFITRRITAAANNMTNMPVVCRTSPAIVANGVNAQFIICNDYDHDHYDDEFGPFNESNSSVQIVSVLEYYVYIFIQN